jgi:hypothetical protein
MESHRFCSLQPIGQRDDAVDPEHGDATMDAHPNHFFVFVRPIA